MKRKFYISKKVFVAFIILLVGKGLYAQDKTIAVRQAVDQLFVAMRTADTALMKQSFTNSAILQTIIDRESVSIQNEDISAFITSIGKLTKGDTDERLGDLLIKVDGKFASVWAPYQFYYKGKFSHCGVNALQLVQMQGQWKIQYIIDTRRKDGCL